MRVEIELPDDLRPVAGGTFYVRFRHPEVTGGEDARVQIGVLHHLLAARSPAEVWREEEPEGEEEGAEEEEPGG